MKILVLFALFLSTAVIYADDIQYVMTDLKEDGFHTSVRDMNDKAQVIGSRKPVDESVLYSRGHYLPWLSTLTETGLEMTDLGLLVEDEQVFIGMNNAGQIVGLAAYSDEPEVKRGILSENTGEGRRMIDLGVDVVPHNINNNGQIAFMRNGVAYLSSMVGSDRVEVELPPIFSGDRVDLQVNDSGKVVGLRNEVAYLSSPSSDTEGRTTEQLNPGIEVDYPYEITSVDISNKDQIVLTISEIGVIPSNVVHKGETYISHETRDGREWRRIEELSGHNVSVDGRPNDLGDFAVSMFVKGDLSPAEGEYPSRLPFVYKSKKLYPLKDIISNLSGGVFESSVYGLNNKGQIFGVKSILGETPFKNANNRQYRIGRPPSSYYKRYSSGFILTPKLAPPPPPALTVQSTNDLQPLNGKWIEERSTSVGAPSKYKPKFN